MGFERRDSNSDGFCIFHVWRKRQSGGQYVPFRDVVPPGIVHAGTHGGLSVACCLIDQVHNWTRYSRGTQRGSA